jgi:low affinity Fe/Cu permease
MNSEYRYPSKTTTPRASRIRTSSMPKNGNSHRQHPPKGEAPPLAVEIARSEAAKTYSFSTWFSSFAAHTSRVVGSPVAFLIAIGVVVVWAAVGRLFHFSDTWQLVINTGTTIVTFLMVFLIQNTQNRDAKGIHLKLNELVHAVKGAHNELIDVEKLSDEELKKLDEYYDRVREECERRDRAKQKKTAS